MCACTDQTPFIDLIGLRDEGHMMHQKTEFQEIQGAVQDMLRKSREAIHGTQDSHLGCCSYDAPWSWQDFTEESGLID